MKTRQFAWRALVILLAAVGLSLYFSGTVRTILTPKVQFTSAKKGRLTDTIIAPCKLIYTDPEEFRYRAPEGVRVDRVYVRPGDWVNKGESLFSLKFINEEEIEKQLRRAVDEALLDKLAFERSHTDIRLSEKEEKYAAAYNALEEAALSEHSARFAAQRLLPGDTALFGEGYSASWNEAVIDAVNRWRGESAKQSEAEQAFAQVSGLRIKSAAKDYIAQRQSIQNSLNAAEEALTTFYAQQEAMREIKTPHPGYIAAVHKKAFEIYDGTQALCTITGETGELLLEADITGTKKTIPEETPVSLETDFGVFQSTVQSTGFNANGAKCAYIVPPKELLDALPLSVLQNAQMKATIVSQTADSYTLLPVSAIHGSEGNRYVFIAEDVQNALGSVQTKVKKFSVSVIDEADGMAAVKEDLGRSRVVYMEDRELSDGSAVMRYIK